MAEGRRMTAAREAVEQLLEREHADVLRESVAWMVAELMEAEVAAQIGAELGERAPEQRTAQRNGYRPRRWDTRVGEIELQIPKLRQGSYFPSILEPRKRSEQALVAVVQEAYINGVCTRKVDRLVEQMGLRGMSKDQVSRLCRGLDEQVAAFREVVAQLTRPAPKVAQLLEAAEIDLLAFYAFPREHWSKLRSTESVGARQPRDRPSVGCRRHLPQRRRPDPARRRPTARAERRVARRPPLPVRRIPLRACRVRQGSPSPDPGGGGRAPRGLSRRPLHRRSAVTPRTAT